MSLRLRLTMLYMSLVGVTLFFFGTLAYEVVSITLNYQVDDMLADSATQLTDLMQVNANNQIDLRNIMTYAPARSLMFQIYNNNSKLLVEHPAGINLPVAYTRIWGAKPSYSTHQVEDIHYRILTVPLTSQKGVAGVLQVAVDMSLLEMTQRTVLFVLVTLALVSMLFSALAAWVVIGRAMTPLAEVTRTATRITHADDLQRRIPLSGPADDEVGRLVTAFNQTLERLEALFNTQRRFLADVSHELRTPLTVIKGNVGLMKRMGEVDMESLGTIDGEVDRLSRLVGDLLLLAQAESGKLPMEHVEVSLDTLLLEVFEQMRLLAGEKLRLRLVEIDQVVVEGDRDRLKQVLLNLVGNAVHYTPTGGQVDLSLRRADGMAQLIVSDNGPGIAPEDLPHIFERFYRGEKSRKRSGSTGFGLGLSIAFWIVRSHSGTIEVNSQEGRGTTFCVWLPLKPKEAN